jgi:hypothetical protein
MLSLLIMPNIEERIMPNIEERNVPRIDKQKQCQKLTARKKMAFLQLMSKTNHKESRGQSHEANKGNKRARNKQAIGKEHAKQFENN